MIYILVIVALLVGAVIGFLFSRHIYAGDLAGILNGWDFNFDLFIKDAFEKYAKPFFDKYFKDMNDLSCTAELCQRRCTFKEAAKKRAAEVKARKCLVDTMDIVLAHYPDNKKVATWIAKCLKKNLSAKDAVDLLRQKCDIAMGFYYADDDAPDVDLSNAPGRIMLLEKGEKMPEALINKYLKAFPRIAEFSKLIGLDKEELALAVSKIPSLAGVRDMALADITPDYKRAPGLISDVAFKTAPGETIVIDQHSGVLQH